MDIDRDVLGYWKTEHQTAAEGHRNLHTLFTRIVSLYITVAVIPITAIVALTQIGTFQETQWLIPTFRIVFLIIAVAEILFIAILIRYRFLIVEAARWLNSLRCVLQKLTNQSWINDVNLPLDPSHPKFYEPFREMGIFVTFGSLVNSGYLYLVQNFPDVCVSTGLLKWALISLAIHHGMYCVMSIIREKGVEDIHEHISNAIPNIRKKKGKQ